MNLELNSSLDENILAEEFSQRGRVQIRNLLTEASARTLVAELQRLPWGLVYNDGNQVVELDAAAVNSMPRDKGASILAAIHEGARNGYQFFYAYYPLFREYFQRRQAPTSLFAAYEFINSETFLAFIRRVTGLEGIRWADGQATLFTAGHFLKCHTDEVPAEQRLAAFVINLTENWGRDWGGVLQFFDERYDVEAYRPAFNAINIFRIPADHSVSVVAPYVRAHRYSITGWFRGDAPPGPIPLITE